MPNDPRLVYGWDESDFHTVAVGADNSLTLPTFTTQGYINTTTYTATPTAVTNVATSTNPPQVGLGSSGNRLFGKIKAVEADGTITVQDRGYMTFVYVTGGSVPVIGSSVAVDGTGKVLVSATFLGAICEGFVVDPASGNTYCLVRRF